MKLRSILTIIGVLSFIGMSMQAQNKTAGPYTVRNSEKFEVPKKHKTMDPIPYGKLGIIQVNSRDLESFNFQLFDNNLKKIKENNSVVGNKLHDDVSMPNFVKLKNKSYLFVREVFRDTKTEGITAMEFDPNSLDFVGTGRNLFKSSDKVRMTTFTMGWGGGSTVSPSGFDAYDFVTSDDKTKFFFSYALVPKDKHDKERKGVIGMYVSDENLKKLWSGEFEMPYTEKKMDILAYTLGNDGKVFLLAKVYEGDNAKEGRDKVVPNFHYEILIYDKGNPEPQKVQIKLEKYYPKTVLLYQDQNQNMILAGFYSRAVNKAVDGYYMVKLDIEKGTVSKVNEGYYEIPSDIIKSYTSDREKRKMEKKERKDEDNDIGVDNLQIRKIYNMPDGTTKVVSEQYVVIANTYYDPNTHSTRTTYNTFADDIFLISIDAKGKLEWVKKLPKAQHSGDARGAGLSLNTYVTGNDLNLFYIDNIKNEHLSVNEAPKRHENGRGGYLTAIRISPNGDQKRYNLGEIDDYETNFYIRYFVDGENNNLISTERRKKEDMLFSIDIKK